ncbi:MAG TPA: FtsX-like permease family protein [Streptosporangiaceae bacterium]
MIRLGLRLTLAGGREAAIRLVITAAAVALGAMLLLSALAGINAVNTQNARYAWISTSVEFVHPHAYAKAAAGAPAAKQTRDPLWFKLSAGYVDGQLYGRVDVAATGPGAPRPPGITRVPGPGQYYASPALTRLLRDHPADQLADRFPGRQVGTIGLDALPSPHSLVVIVGEPQAQLAHQPGASKVTSIETIPPSGCDGTDCVVGVGIGSSGIDLILSCVAAGLLFPVLIFIGSASRLSAARREQRFAAMRLAGATPRQVSLITMIESIVAAAVGVAGGFGLFYLLRPAIATIPFTGAPFFTGDLSLSLADVAAVALGVPVAAAVAALIALRRVQISPLGVTRRVTPKPPGIWRLIPLLAGIAELAVFTVIGRPGSTGGQIQAFLPGFLLLLAGLVIAGPWLTMAGARLMARRAQRAGTLVAARRLADNPRAGFRAISGLIVALFVTSVAVGVITTMASYRTGPTATPQVRNTVVEAIQNPVTGNNQAVPMPAAMLARLQSTAGVQGVTLVHTNPLKTSYVISQGHRGFLSPAGLASCAELARTPVLGRCRAGAQVVSVPPQGTDPFAVAQDKQVWQAATFPAGRLARLPITAVVVTTNGAAADDRVQTVLAGFRPSLGSAATIAETNAYTSSNQVLVMEEQLANVIILASLPIAGCALAASVVSGLTERKRPFSLLRLAGTPLSVLRRVVTLESALPLLVVAVVSIAVGFAGAELFLRAQLGYTLRPPGAGYYGIVLAGLAAALGIIAATLPLLKRMTGPEVARND